MRQFILRLRWTGIVLEIEMGKRSEELTKVYNWTAEGESRISQSQGSYREKKVGCVI